MWATALFYLFISWEPVKNDLVTRYFTGFWISYVATGLFFVGLASLALKLWNVLGQESAFRGIDLPRTNEAGESTDAATTLLASLDGVSKKIQRTYLWERLHNLFEFVQRKSSSNGIGEELKYLADIDADRQQESYALVRIITWATPMLGFLGTVIGVTQALGGLSIDNTTGNIEIGGLVSGLYIAFDTTALALSLAIVLMFLWFIVDRFETGLLTRVDMRANKELVGRFSEVGAGKDPHLASIELMCQSILSATENLVTRQAEMWSSTIAAANQHWVRTSDEIGEQLQGSLTKALSNALAHHAEKLAENEGKVSVAHEQQWDKWRGVLAENARLMHAHQKEMSRQSESLSQAVTATGDIINLETALNQNLDSLANAKHFEDTLNTLSAALHLMIGRLGNVTDTRVNLGGEGQRVA